jgi:hypothetical protein
VPLSAPRDSTIAIVGDGFGSLLVYGTAVYLGFEREQVTVYGPSTNPVGTYQQFAYNLGQTILRSESESHFLPADWPTFAQLDAWARRSPRPLLRSLKRKYNPGVGDILGEATMVARRLGWDDNRYPVRVGWVQREWSPSPHFVLYDEQANYVGRARHVILAVGHGPLSFPPALAAARQDPQLENRIVQGYEAKQYAAGGTYVVIGAGIASVNEWANAIDAGARVISLLRNPKPEEQDLNTPRCLFEAFGIDIYQALPLEQRLTYLGKVLKGTAPGRRGWQERVERARAEGRFAELQGEIDQVQPGPAGLRIHVSSRDGNHPGWLDVSGVVSATGFQKSALTVPLLRRLIEHYRLPVTEGRLALKRNCGVPGLDVPESRLGMMGIHANVVIPNGDTIAGLKYIARRFVVDCVEAEQLKRRPFFARLKMQLELASASADVIRQTRRAEQLA